MYSERGVILLTETEKRKITNLRKRGFSGIQIAEKLKIDGISVSIFLSRSGQKAPVCEMCGKKLVPDIRKKTRRFCSDRCRMKWWNAHPELLKHRKEYAIVCAGCGKEFVSPGRKNRKYCSRECFFTSMRKETRNGGLH